jgi:fructose-bisphosphate aldolase, class I
MNKDILIKTVERLMERPKGILAIDESISTCNKRFEKLGVETTEEKRRQYREMLVTAPDIEKYISGYIFFDETLRQKTVDGVSFISIMKDKGIEVGIKVDQGTVDLDPALGEKVTTGLDGLTSRLEEYKQMGASFAKWRAIYKISATTPSDLCIKVNAEALVEYALKCQEQDIVPIIEPEILIEGEHSIETCYDITAKNFQFLFTSLNSAGVFLPGIILKTSMVIAGESALTPSTPAEVAQMTLKCLIENVPKEVGGIVFLSGGQTDEMAVSNLDHIGKSGPQIWPITFSYGRAIQNKALMSWSKNPTDFTSAQALLLESAKANSFARIGQYK